jgi:hypothetical protein
MVPLVGCKKTEQERVENPVSRAPELPPLPRPAANPAEFSPCNLYYPLVPGSQLKYTIIYSSGIIADVDVVVDQLDEGGRKVYTETTRIVDNQGGNYKSSQSVRKYACDDGRPVILSEHEDNRVEGNRTVFDIEFSPEAVAMARPSAIRRGYKWSYNMTQTFRPENLPPVRQKPLTIYFEVVGEEEVKVPAGRFRAIKILRKVGENQVIEYYARGIGLVRRETTEGTSWSLKEFGGLKPVD